MPYIPRKERQRFDPHIEKLFVALTEKWSPADLPGRRFWHCGELNYVISRLCDHLLQASDGLGYSALQNLVGTLECVKQEFYRRQVALYEDEKIEEHGDLDTAAPHNDAIAREHGYRRPTRTRKCLVCGKASRGKHRLKLWECPDCGYYFCNGCVDEPHSCSGTR